MPRLFDQLELEFCAESSLSSAAYHELARTVAGEFGDGRFELEPYTRGSERGIEIRRGARVVGGIELWISKDLGELGVGAPGRRDLHARWNDETTERTIGSNYRGGRVGVENESTLRMATAFVRGIKGFEAYDAYLHALARAIKKQEPTATVYVGTSPPTRDTTSKGADGLTPGERVARGRLVADGKMSADGMWIPKAARERAGASE